MTVGTVHVGTAFAGPIGFTLSDGSTDFASGDRFLITVATGSGKYKEYNPANTDGSETAVALLLDNVDATSGDSREFQNKLAAEVEAAPEGAVYPEVSIDYSALMGLLRKCQQ